MDEEKIKNVGKEKNAGLMFPYFILITINPGKSSEIRNAIHLKRRRGEALMPRVDRRH